MTVLDSVILVGVIVSLILIGLAGQDRNKSTEDYFLAGRGLRWWQIGFSLFATNFSASAIIGITGAAYLTGLAIYNYEWVGILAMLFFALILVSVVRGSRVYTLADYLSRRYDSRVKMLYSGFIIFLIVFIDMAGSLYAGGLLLSEIFPSLSMNLIIILIMLLAGVYSIAGGMKAISRTDMFQSVIMIAGALLISYFVFNAAGGWSTIKANAAEESLSLIRPHDDRAVPWMGLLTGIPVLCAYFWLTNQNMVQWVLSAKSAPEARRGLIMAGYLKLLVLFIVILPGVAAAQIMPGLAEADRVYPTLLLTFLPVGVFGFVLAGFIAALMSNTDSTLHAASTIITMDFARTSRPDMSSESLVWVGRCTTGGIILISALWAPMIGGFGTLFEYVQGILSYAVAPFVVVYLGGLFWPRATSSGAIAALIFGLLTAIAIGFFGDVLGLFEIHYLNVPFPVMIVSVLAFILGSKRDAPPTVDPKLLWSKSELFFKNDAMRSKDLVFALGLIVLIAIQVIFFW